MVIFFDVRGKVFLNNLVSYVLKYLNGKVIQKIIYGIHVITMISIDIKKRFFVQILIYKKAIETKMKNANILRMPII